MLLKKHFLLFGILLIVALAAKASKVDTLMVRSISMKKDVQVIVVAPDIATKEGGMPCPVIYLLHGYGGDATSWLTIKPELSKIADEKGLIFVCPDGKNNWYWNSPKNPMVKYETFISSELVKYIDKYYKTIANRKGRAITGLSMGGHGALWNAFRHQSVFGAAGSTSGGVDIRPFPKNWEMIKQLGELTSNRKLWDEHTVINQIDLLTDGNLAIIIDCGVNDFFLEVNKNFHQCLLNKKISHDFILRPGAHNANYWNNSIDYQILFFQKYFKKQ